jgi:hypothetical protein
MPAETTQGDVHVTGIIRSIVLPVALALVGLVALVAVPVAWAQTPLTGARDRV